MKPHNLIAVLWWEFATEEIASIYGLGDVIEECDKFPWSVIPFSPIVWNQEPQIAIAVERVLYLSDTDMHVRSVVRPADVYDFVGSETKGALDFAEDERRECCRSEDKVRLRE